MSPIGLILGLAVNFVVYKSVEVTSVDELRVRSSGAFLVLATLAMVLYAYTFVPETLDAELRKKAKINLDELNPFQYFDFIFFP